MSEEQLAFDIEGMLHQAAVESTPEWRGAPLHFTTAYYPPAELDAALDHWMFLHAHDKTHANMWRHSITVPDNARVAGQVSRSTQQTCVVSRGNTPTGTSRASVSAI